MFFFHLPFPGLLSRTEEEDREAERMKMEIRKDSNANNDLKEASEKK